MRHNYLDFFIRRKLDKLKNDASGQEDMWAGIEQALDENNARNSSRAWKHSGIAAALLLLLGSGSWYGLQQYYGQAGAPSATAQVTDIPANVLNEITAPGENPDKKNSSPFAANTISRGTNINDETARPGLLMAEGAREHILNTEVYGSNPNRHASHRAPYQAAAQSRQSAAYREKGANQFPANKTHSKDGQLMAMAASVQNMAETSLPDEIEADGLPAKYRNRDEERKERYASKSENWQSVMYNFWDNPAYTGSEALYNINADNRSLIIGGSGQNERLSHFAFDMQIPEAKMGLGVYHERNPKPYSLITKTAFTASYRILNTNDGFLSIGGGVSYITKDLFSYDLHYSDQLDPVSGGLRNSDEKIMTSFKPVAGLDAGLWYTGHRLNLGFNLDNINQPHFASKIGTDAGSSMLRRYNLSGAYRISAGSRLNITPIASISASRISYAGSTMVLADLDKKFMLGAGYRNIDPVTLSGELTAYAGYQYKHRARVFASYARNTAWAQKGIHQHIIQTGIRIQLP